MDLEKLENEEMDNVITLKDEDGVECKFEFLDLITYQGHEYVVLLPVSEDEDAEEVVILLVEGTDGEEESYSGIEDQETLRTIFEMFKAKFKDEFNFVD